MKQNLIQTSRTHCSYCEKLIDDTGKNIGEFIIHCGRSNVVGNNLNQKLKGGEEIMVVKKKVVKNKKMEAQQTTEKKPFGKTCYTKCSKCSEEKFAREDIYKKRVEKFGSVDKMNANYICRKCKSSAKAE